MNLYKRAICQLYGHQWYIYMRDEYICHRCGSITTHDKLEKTVHKPGKDKVSKFYDADIK